MKYLEHEFNILELYMPGFLSKMRSLDFREIEKENSEVLQLFKDYGGIDLVIPSNYGGKGLSAPDMVRIQRAMGSLSPSLAIATNMHQFSVATLVEMAKSTEGIEWMLLQAVAEAKMLVASAFAEGKPGASILEPFLEVEASGDNFIINGSKKPCSLAKSMDLITLSIKVPCEGGSKIAVALLPADTPGIEIKHFWESPLLKAAESEEVVFNNVVINKQLISYTGDSSDLDLVQTNGFIWFELLLTASYLGMCSRLMEKLISAKRSNDFDIVEVAGKLENSMNTLITLAENFMRGDCMPDDLLGHILMARYAIQEVIETTSCRCVEALGGMSYISDPEVSYLLAATKAISFHPPSRVSMTKNLASWIRGEKLMIC